jgi:CubicO group peptidase (beta-lactamase class C family)
LLDHTLLSAAMTATILVPRVNSPQPGGPLVDKYTYGFAYQQVNGVTFVGHNGGTPGYTGQIDIYPGTGYVVVILTNQDDTLVPAIQRSESILTGS